jgi:DNA-binding GntR family transcriptional regulator
MSDPFAASLYEKVKSRLLTGEFEPGQRLRAEGLRRDYGVSATTMREILFRLSTVGLADFQEQRGFRIPEQSLERQHDLTQFRIFLEQQGARLSIELGGVAWEAQLSAAHHKLSHIEQAVGGQSADPALLALWTAAERDFHRTLIGACDSDVLKSTHGVIYDQFRQQLITVDRNFVFLPQNVAQHQVILDAALAKDAPLICSQIEDHLSRHLIRPLAKRGVA